MVAHWTKEVDSTYLREDEPEQGYCWAMAECYGLYYQTQGLHLLEYNPNTDIWTQIAIPTATNDQYINWAVNCNGFLYAGMVEKEDPLSEQWLIPKIYRYYPGDGWTLVYDWTGSRVLFLHGWRAITFGTSIYIAMDRKGNINNGEIWRFSPGGSTSVVNNNIPPKDIPQSCCIFNYQVWFGFFDDTNPAASRDHYVMYSDNGSSWNTDNLGITKCAYALSGYRDELYLASGGPAIYKRYGDDDWRLIASIDCPGCAHIWSLYEAINYLWIGAGTVCLRTHYFDGSIIRDNLTIPVSNWWVKCYGLVRKGIDYKLMCFTEYYDDGDVYRLDDAEDWSICLRGPYARALDVSQQDGTKIHIAAMGTADKPMAFAVPSTMNYVEQLYPNPSNITSTGIACGIISEFYDHDKVYFFGKIDGFPIQYAINDYVFSGIGIEFQSDICRNALRKKFQSNVIIAVTDNNGQAWQQNGGIGFNLVGQVGFDPLGAARQLDELIVGALLTGNPGDIMERSVNVAVTWTDFDVGLFNNYQISDAVIVFSGWLYLPSGV